MMTRRHISIAAVVVILAIASVTIYRITKPAPAATTATDAQNVLYWYDPMRPEQHFDKPGKSPFMDMQLVPRYAQEQTGTTNNATAPSAAKLLVDARSLQKLGVRLATVERGVIAAPITAVGNIEFNERDITILQTRSAGFVQRVYGLAVGDSVARGAPLVDLLVPEWFGVQQELLAVWASGDNALIEAARARALALGMPATALAELTQHRQARQIFTIAAPQAGVIKALDIRAGMSVPAGAPIATIYGIERVWLEMAVPQILAQSITVGAHIEANFNALPGVPHTGTVIAVLPESDAATRTLRVRAELNNPRGDLRPGLLAQVRFVDIDSASALLVPAAAVISGGIRDRVIVANGDGSFTPVLVGIGRADQDRIEILQGLSAGQQVVVSGQFLIDSEANLTGQLQRLLTVQPQRLENTVPPAPRAERQP